MRVLPGKHVGIFRDPSRFVVAVAPLLLAVAGAFATHQPIAAQQDVRARDARRALAARPGDSLAIWILLEPTAARSELPPPLTPSALERRRAMGIPIFEEDAPIPSALIRRLEAAGAVVRTTSRWLRAVSAWADSATAERLRQLPEVRSIELVHTLSRPAADVPGDGLARVVSQADAIVNEARIASSFSALDSADYGLSYSVLRQLAIPEAHALGFTGRNIPIAILSSGFNRRHPSLLSLPPPLAVFDFINDDSIVADQSGDPLGAAAAGTWAWSVAGGFQLRRLIGPAYESPFLLAKVDDRVAETRADESHWVEALEWADAHGARVVISTVAYRRPDGRAYTIGELNGDFTPTTRAADEAARRGILVVTAVGDEPSAGVSSLMAPADADSVLSVGAVDSLGRRLGYSARGPAGSGRIKPELTARGDRVPAAAYLPTDTIDFPGGTGLAAALIGGSAALFLQAWPFKTPQEVIEALTRAGSQRGSPNNEVGWGVPDVASAIAFPGGVSPFVITGITRDTATSVAPTLGWLVPEVHAVAQPVRYRLQVARDSLFQRLVYEDTVVDAFGAVLNRPLAAADTLYWRVVAETAPGVTRVFRAPSRFVMPSWVRLVTLNSSQGSFLQNTPQPTLVWSALEAPEPVGPLRFQVEVISALTGQTVQRLENIPDTTVTLPEALAFNQPFRWRVITRAATSTLADTVESAGSFVLTSTEAPPVTLLYQNFPNPFPRADLNRNSTEIWFDLDRTTTVDLAIYDLRGRLVRRLIPSDPGCGPVQLAAGQYGRALPGNGFACVETSWDGRDENGALVARGLYLIRLLTTGGQQTRRVLFLPD